jgi:uncharacterized sulfatase
MLLRILAVQAGMILCSDPKCQPIKARLSAELERWLAQQGDPGVALDTQEALQSAREGKHRYVPEH